MKHSHVLICAALVGLLTTPASAATRFVTNGADSGPGSFRVAVEQANTNSSITSIIFRGGFDIALGTTVTYEGAQPLRIDGRGTTIDGGGGLFDLFLANGGGDLDLRRLAFRNSGWNGILVAIPGDALGDISVSLFDVTISDNALFGLLVDDLTDSSDASISLDISSSRVTGNGRDDVDLDGVRVDEGGDGDIVASVHRSEFTGNGADGFELDESGVGDVVLFARHSTFDGNGQTPGDTDDGVDIDEADDGDVWFRIVHATFDDNTDDGIDMDEDGEGDMHASLVQVETLGNGDKGVNLGENGPGDFEAKVNVVLIEGNGDVGLRMREFDDGDFFARVVRSAVLGNDLDIEVEEDGDGAGTLRLQNVSYDTFEPDGVTLEP
jgi:hypothetical protein